MASNLIAEQDRDGYIRRFTIASWNLRGEETDEAGQTLVYQYSSLAKVTESSTPTGPRPATTTTNGTGSPACTAGALREEYIYDVDSHFIEKRDGKRQVLFTNEPHKNHLVGKRTLKSGGYHLFDYDARGRVTEATTDQHEVKLSYGAGRWASSDLRDGKGVKHTRSLSTQDTHLLERFLVRREPSQSRTTLDDAAGRRTTIVYDEGMVRRYCPNGTIETLQLDLGGPFAGASGLPLTEWSRPPRARWGHGRRSKAPSFRSTARWRLGQPI